MEVQRLFFGDQRTDLTINKANFPGNTLAYVNNGSISAVRRGQTAIYLDYVILAQILPVINFPDNLDNYQYKDNEVLLYFPLYNTQNGLYKGLKKSLAIIVLRGDELESFYSYGFDKEKSKTIYCVNKQPLPNIFQRTAFKKHTFYLMDQRNQDFSKMFMFLPSTLDRKEELNQYLNNVNLYPTDVSFDQLKKLNDRNYLILLIWTTSVKEIKSKTATALRCGSFSEENIEKSPCAVMIRIVITFGNQIFL